MTRTCIKIITAIVSIFLLEILCHLSFHALHLWLMPIEISIAAWAGINLHRCKCNHKTQNN